MKMKKEHYDVLKQHILDTIPKIPSQEAYKENGLSDKRYRWDLLYKSGLKIGDGVGTQGLPLYAYMDDMHIDTALRKILSTNSMNDIDEINEIRNLAGLNELKLPELKVDDEMMVGKFKNRKAKITGFTTDKHNQPIAKTDKGEQQIFKGRIKKLMDEPETTNETIKETTSTLVNHQINEINEIRSLAGIPIAEDTKKMDEMLQVIRALKGAYLAMSQIKTDLEDDHLINRMGMSNGEYINATIGNHLSEISGVLGRFSDHVRNDIDKDEVEPEEKDRDEDIHVAPEFNAEEEETNYSSEENNPDSYSNETDDEPETPEYENMKENTSAGGMGAGSIASSVAGNKKGTSSFHELVRKNEDEAKRTGKKPKKVETIFAMSQD